MADNFAKLFERTYIGKHGVKNRFVMAPMGLGPSVRPRTRIRYFCHGSAFLRSGTQCHDHSGRTECIRFRKYLFL